MSSQSKVQAFNWHMLQQSMSLSTIYWKTVAGFQPTQTCFRAVLNVCSVMLCTGQMLIGRQFGIDIGSNGKDHQELKKYEKYIKDQEVQLKKHRTLCSYVITSLLIIQALVGLLINKFTQFFP